MSSPTSIKLLEDRIKFKFHAAKEHLKNLKCLEAKGETANAADARVKWEIEIEDLLSHLIGARDALLVRINEKFNLKVKKRDIYLANLTEKLVSKGMSNPVKGH
jgi:hypothetical protein